MALEPENTQYLRDLSISFDRLGGLDARTDPLKAREWFEQRLKIARQLVALEPGNTWYILDLSVSFERLGGLDAQTAPLKAREWFEQGSEVLQRLLALDPENQNAWYGLACAYARIETPRQALDALTRSVDFGNTGADWAAKDDDLASLRGLPEFEALLERMRTPKS